MKYAAFVLVSISLIGSYDFGAEDRRHAMLITGGTPERGEATIERFGCATCHTIPGIRGANGLVGPPLDRMGSRMYIAGVLQNTPSNMIRWIQSPPEIDSQTAMPDLGISEAQARDIASYLYTLK